jgi:hypothetical protein
MLLDSAYLSPEQEDFDMSSLFLLALAISYVTPVTDGADAETNISLTAAVDDFNLQTMGQRFYYGPNALTEEEVIAAIRAWRPDPQEVTDEVYQRYQSIADSEELPAGAKLTLLTGLNTGTHKVVVWWVDLRIKIGPDSGYSIRIRDQKISSRELTPAEQEANRARTRRIQRLRERASEPR